MELYDYCPRCHGHWRGPLYHEPCTEECRKAKLDGIASVRINMPKK
jgi:hypothetical protein